MVQVPIRQPKKRYFHIFKMKLLFVFKKLNPFYKPPVLPPKSIPPARPEIQLLYTSNFSSRKRSQIACIVLHNTGSLDTEKAIEWFQSGVSQTSTHYLISPTGNIFQLVQNTERSWHVSSLVYYTPKDKLSNVSLSIHLVGNGNFTKEQNESLAKLCKYLLHIYHLPSNSIYTHTHFESSKECPLNFDIQKFRLQLK